jgi:predicted transglutaminase-like cysteine proteinase
MRCSRTRLQIPVALLALAMLPSRAWDAALMQAAAHRLGPPALAALAPLQTMLLSLRGLEETERLRVVNQFFNQRIAFATDLEVWGQEDYWASPLETLAKGRGDCEDFAIAKYASLLAAGVAPGRLRLVYVRAQLDGAAAPKALLDVGLRIDAAATPAAAGAQAHMVLAYQVGPAEEPLILDNLRGEVLPASARPDLTPVFSFSTDGLWHGNGHERAGDPMARLSRWRTVWAKARQEGFL